MLKKSSLGLGKGSDIPTTHLGYEENDESGRTVFILDGAKQRVEHIVEVDGLVRSLDSGYADHK